MSNTSITITKKEYYKLIKKSKSGWFMYFKLLENDIEHNLQLQDKLNVIIDNSKIEDYQFITEKTQSLLDGLKERNECCICLDTLNKDNSKLKRCLHRFHIDCITLIEQTGNYSCPICRDIQKD